MEILMLKRNLAVIAAALGIAGAANAAPEWIQIVTADSGSTFMDRSFTAPAGTAMAVRVMRNYDDTVSLGTDPATGLAMYPHRSVKVTYLVDCGNRKLALDGWQMFSGNFGDGDVVWADKHPGAPLYLNPEGVEEKFALANACAARAVVSAR
jgi:hypothetical protein